MNRTTRDENETLSYLKGRAGDLRQELRELPEHRKGTPHHFELLDTLDAILRRIGHIAREAEKEAR